MKKNIVILFLYLVFSSHIYSQVTEEDYKYNRSSLHLVLIESETFPKKEIVMKAWDGYPFPDKYNNHSIDVINMDLANYGKIDPEDKEMKIKINQFIQDTDLAKKLIAKWFKYDGNGNFDMSLIQERGLYDASYLETEIAKGQVRGIASLADAGEELINNTFVTFSKLFFVDNEIAAKLVKDEAEFHLKQRNLHPLLEEPLMKEIQKKYERASEGYSVWTNTWLYQLEWNDSIGAVFYSELWNNKEAFESSDIFRMNYVGTEFSRSLVTFNLKSARTEEEIINLSTVRNIDKVLAKLQKKYDVFKPRVPVLSTDPIVAKIGMKESIKAGDRFNVMEIVYDKKQGVTKYKTIGEVKVDKKYPVWDNRFAADEAEEGKKDKPSIEVTTFKGSSKVQPGMLLKLVK